MIEVLGKKRKRRRFDDKCSSCIQWIAALHMYPMSNAVKALSSNNFSFKATWHFKIAFSKLFLPLVFDSVSSATGEISWLCSKATRNASLCPQWSSQTKIAMQTFSFEKFVFLHVSIFWKQIFGIDIRDLNNSAKSQPRSFFLKKFRTQFLSCRLQCHTLLIGMTSSYFWTAWRTSQKSRPKCAADLWIEACDWRGKIQHCMQQFLKSQTFEFLVRTTELSFISTEKKWGDLKTWTRKCLEGEMRRQDVSRNSARKWQKQACEKLIHQAPKLN